MRYISYVSYVGMLAAVVSLPLLPGSALAQSMNDLEVGETVRVNGEFVGRVVAVEETDLTVFGQGRPTCTAGIYHGESAICTSAPMEQLTVDLSVVTVEREITGAGRTKGLLLGAIVGGVAGAGTGYVIGPVIGFGRLSTCVDRNGLETCSYVNTPPDVQRSSDQWRGTVFLGFVGATVGALLANALVDDWITVRPAARSAGGSSGWSFELALPLSER